MNLHATDPGRYTITGLCELFGVSKQAYHKYDEDAAMAKMAREEFVVQFILEVRARDHGIGGLKLWHMYQRAFGADKPIGRDRFEDIVDRYGLKVRNKVRKPRTTDSRHGLSVYPNLTRDFMPTGPNQLWVSDITYITMWTGPMEYAFCYLSLILDAYTEEIVGWSVGATLEAACPVEALKMALRRLDGKKADGLIHHSDRGCQYASKDYISILKKNHIRISMTENGNPKDNAQAERINNTIKNELFKDVTFRSIREVVDAMSDAVDFYNNDRPHMSIDMMTPSEASGRMGEIRKRWKSYRLAAIKGRQQAYSDIPGKCLPLSCRPGLTAGRRPQGDPGQG